MTQKQVPPRGEPFPLGDFLETTEEREAFRDQSFVLQAGALIRRMRETAKLTQRDLARRVGTSQPHLSELERGTGTQGPTFLMLQKIAEACGATLRIEVSEQSKSRRPDLFSGVSIREIESSSAKPREIEEFVAIVERDTVPPFTSQESPTPTEPLIASTYGKIRSKVLSPPQAELASASSRI